MDLKRSFVILCALVCSEISNASGAPCSTLNGAWINELGSTINLIHSGNGDLSGTYLTKVERDTGSSGSNHSAIFGSSPYDKPGAVFGFSVMWKGGNSMTSWTGQCLVCSDGEEILETSWLLKSKVAGCDDVWKSTMIGQNTFKRTSAPSQPGRFRRESPDARSIQVSDPAQEPCQSLSGHWYNQVGSEMIITTHSNNSIKGEYRTAVERCEGAAGSGHSYVYGVSNTADPSSTVSLYVVWNNGESITGWVGQCHVCGEGRNETLQLTWLLRTRIDSCHDNWLASNYGETTFTRYEQKAGPRKSRAKHTPGEAGEKTSRTSAVCSVGSQEVLGSGLLILFGCVISVVRLM